MIAYANSYIDLLKRYPDFENTNANYNYFKYSKENDEELIKLRNKYNLDEIAVGNNTFSKVTSLMDWVHNELFFVGENITPKDINALGVLEFRKKGALFCLYQSLVLNETLLSIGIKSRIIRCLPYEFDMDCHVGVIVFIPEVQEWIFFDPTFNTYFIDSIDKPLSVIQIRDCYKSGKIPNFKHIPIKKDWALIMNGIECNTYDDWYSIYMAKNCFRFSSPIESAVNYIESDNEKIMFLNPLGFDMKNEYDFYIKNPNDAIYTNNVKNFFSNDEPL